MSSDSIVLLLPPHRTTWDIYWFIEISRRYRRIMRSFFDNSSLNLNKNFNVQMHVWLDFFCTRRFPVYATYHNSGSGSVSRHPDRKTVWNELNLRWLCCTWPGADCGQLHRLSYMIKIHQRADRAQFFPRPQSQLFLRQHPQQATEDWKQKLWNIRYSAKPATYCPPFLNTDLHFNIRFQFSRRINISAPSAKLSGLPPCLTSGEFTSAWPTLPLSYTRHKMFWPLLNLKMKLSTSQTFTGFYRSRERKYHP